MALNVLSNNLLECTLVTLIQKRMTVHIFHASCAAQVLASGDTAGHQLQGTIQDV